MLKIRFNLVILIFLGICRLSKDSDELHNIVNNIIEKTTTTMRTEIQEFSKGGTPTKEEKDKPNLSNFTLDFKLDDSKKLSIECSLEVTMSQKKDEYIKNFNEKSKASKTKEFIDEIEDKLEDKNYIDDDQKGTGSIEITSGKDVKITIKYTCDNLKNVDGLNIEQKTTDKTSSKNIKK